MPNSNDGTQLGTGEVISDEYIDPNGLVRRDVNLPVGPLKVPRSKLGVGGYGVDAGDATPDNSLPVESRQARIYAEYRAVQESDLEAIMLLGDRGSRVTSNDSRGVLASLRGTR